MKCQDLFSGKNTTNISKCRLLEFLPSGLSVKLGSVMKKELYFNSRAKRKKCLRTCTKWADLHNPVHAQVLIRAFTFRSYFCSMK